MNSRNSAQLSPTALVQMNGTAIPAASWTPLMSSGTANVIAISNTRPKMTETTIDITMPSAAERDAIRVSSLMCAEASKPVIVYCAINRPSANTNQNAGWPKFSPLKPDALSVLVKTKLTD